MEDDDNRVNLVCPYGEGLTASDCSLLFPSLSSLSQVISLISPSCNPIFLFYVIRS